MGTVDFSSESAHVWMRSVRAVEALGLERTLRRRPAANRAERLIAHEVQTRLHRSQVQVTKPEAMGVATPIDKRPTRRQSCCSKCGAPGSGKGGVSLRLVKTIWHIGTSQPPEDIYVCRDGCAVAHSLHKGSTHRDKRA